VPPDLNMMLRQTALNGLQQQLDAAVTNGDTEAARKVTNEIAQLTLQTAPKAPAFGDAEIMSALDTKAPWYGIDPKKSKAAMDFGKTMNPKKFATAEAFADAIIAAVDAEFKPATAASASTESEDETDETEDDPEDPPTKKPKRTDGPGHADAVGGSVARTGNKGPWLKMSDAPNDVRAEIKRTADKFAPSTKEGREAFEKRALEAHYAAHQRSKQGKK